MDRNPNLSLPPRDDQYGRPNRARVSILAGLVAIILAGAVFFLAKDQGGGRPAGATGLSKKSLETLALKFEDQKLPGAAARAWGDYLDAARPGGQEAARIWFRIGKLYQDGNDYERAIEAYYRSEAIAKVAELEPEISKRTAECLEALGNYTALNAALEERTAVGKSDSTGSGEVLAEVGTWKITRADLSSMIEAQIDAELSQVAGGLTPEERNAQKQRLLDNVSKQGGEGELLQRFIVEEMLYRRAREEKLMDDPQYRSLTRNLERQLLAQKYLDSEYAKRINIGTDDVKAYYDAHKDQFKKDGKLQAFDLVKGQAYGALRQEKEMQVQQQLLGELRERYNVVIHTSAIGGKQDR